MKKAIEEVVDRNQDIVEYIVRLATESDVWIFISDNLFDYLISYYRRRHFLDGDICYGNNNQNAIGLPQEHSFGSKWREVDCIYEWFGRQWKDTDYIYKSRDAAADPEVIYFLS